MLDVLSASLGAGPGGVRTSEFFRWKHLENPFGPSYMLVAESDGRIVGLRAFMRWAFEAEGHRLTAVRAVDTATHPDHQGKGIFSTLTRRALEDLAEQVELVFNTPNDESLPGYLKMGWRIVGTIPIWVRVRHPVRFASGIRSRERDTVGIHPPLEDRGGISAAEALADAQVADLLRTCQRGLGIETTHDVDYLRWRYGSAPLLRYRAVAERDGGELRGMAFFRVRWRRGSVECTVADVLVRSGDGATARRLLAKAARASGADHLTCSFPRGSAPRSAIRRAPYLRAPGGMTLVVNPLGHDLRADPFDPRSWALSLGDLEVF